VGRSEEKAGALAKVIFKEFNLPARAFTSAEKAARGAQIICGTTHTVEPLIEGRWLEPGTHVNSVGLNAAGREVDGAAVAKSLVVVESRHAALAPFPAGANDLTWPIRDGLIKSDHIHAEIGELVSGSRPGRTSPGQITLYKSVGVAVQDAVAANLVLAAALERRVGKEVDL
jgi:ornithine cyclodeaminase/alanine dehydrogenase-like protein (mu-crystallin family)